MDNGQLLLLKRLGGERLCGSELLCRVNVGCRRMAPQGFFKCLERLIKYGFVRYDVVVEDKRRKRIYFVVRDL